MNKKQLRLTIVLLILIAACVTGGLLMGRTKPLSNLFPQIGSAISRLLHGEQKTTQTDDQESVLNNQASKEILQQVKQDNRGLLQPVATEVPESTYTLQARSLLKKNQGKKAEAVKMIYTTKRAVAFMFSGLGNSQELDNVLQSLKRANAVGQFFVTLDDINQNPDQIRKIAAAGMAFGISYVEKESVSIEETLAEWLQIQKRLEEEFSAGKITCVHQLFGSIADPVCIAASAAGFTLVEEQTDAIPATLMYASKGQDIVDYLFPSGKKNLRLGQTVHFRMNYIQSGNTILSDTVTILATEKTAYSVVPVTEILEDISKLYTYPVPESKVLPELQNKIYPGQLKEEDINTALKTRYIGTSWVKSSAFLPGFSYKERGLLDTYGKVKGSKNAIFLTFDDWGTDYSIDPLLQVLKKHNVKATFFVRSQNVSTNPNLLRAIAEDGHDIANHTYTHTKLSTMEKAKLYKELTETERKALEQDLLKSHQTLLDVVGDVRNANGPALTLLFRPPTLAVSRSGLLTVLDCGFTYSVSGFQSTQDYEAGSAQQVFRSMKNYTTNGAIMILHFTQNAQYTAQGVDMYLTYLENGGKYHAEPLSNYYR